MIQKLKYIVLIALMFIVMNGCISKKQEDIYIVFTSDVHCAVNDNFTMASLKAYVDDLKKEHSYVTLVDTGDYLQGSEIGSLSKGAYIIDLMNYVGYDIVTYGNHEFDFGLPVLKDRIDSMEFSYVASNVRYSGNGYSIFEDVPTYIIRDYGQRKVAFIGILTPSTILHSTSAYFKEDGEFVYDFYLGNNGEDLYKRIQEVTDEARNKGADYVIALSHLGSDISYEPYDSLSMISHTHGIDVFLDGHSHSLISEDHILNKNGEEVLLCSVGTKLQEVGTLIIDKKGQLSVVDMEVYDRKDEATQNYISYIYAELDYVLSEKIGELEFDLDIADDQGIRMVRNRETNLGDFVADAFRYVFDSDIGIINGGGIRDKLPAGEITVRDLLNVTPYQNYGSCILASGQVIMDELESAVKEVERLYSFDGNPVGEAGGFLQVSGLRFTIDTSIPSPVKTDENGTYLGIEGERRIKDLEVLQYGEYVPIDPEAMYTVASYDYVLSDESETRHLFYKCEKIIENVYLDIDILKMYFQALDKEDLQSYSKQQGRIIVR